MRRLIGSLVTILAVATLLAVPADQRTDQQFHFTHDSHLRRPTNPLQRQTPAAKQGRLSAGSAG